jgi:hypothetical protein
MCKRGVNALDAAITAPGAVRAWDGGSHQQIPWYRRYPLEGLMYL